jgi:dipeptidyl aminopeptidase/acylaminoacyl peptidase
MKRLVAVLGVCAVAVTAAPAAAEPLDDGVVSPDGRRIAWVGEDGKSVWSATRKGHGWSTPEQVLTIRGTVDDLVFSPDSDRLAFENPRGDHGFIAVYGFRSDRISFVDPSFGTDTDPVWSRDGRRMSFVRHVEGVPDRELTRPVEPPKRRGGRSTLESMLAAPFVSGLTASGDGRAVAYIAREATDRSIYLGRVGKRAERLVRYGGDDGQELSQLAVSREGGAIAYVRGGEPNDEGEIPNPNTLPDPPRREVWITDGGRPQLLGEGSAPQFAPGDDRVIWVADQTVMSASLTWRGDRLLAVGEPQLLFTFQGSLRMLRFSPDGRRIAYQRSSGIELFDVATGQVAAIPHPGASDADPSWSPDGSRIAFRRTVSGQPWSIWVASLPDLAAREIWRAEAGLGSAFYGLDQDNELLWSGDEQIAFAWERDGWRHLYAVPAAGGDATLLTAGDGEVESAVVTRDRERLIYTTNIGDIGRRHLSAVGFDGTPPVAITSGRASQWAPVPLAGSALAYVHAGWADPPAVMLRGPDGRTEAAGLPRVPGSFPEDEFVEPQLVEFPASDGQTAYGQLFVPERGAPRDRCAIVFPHGGPRRQMLPGFHYIDIYTHLYELNQYLASRGCVVLSVDYRSGIGHGYAFRNAEGRGRAGASEYRDILGAVEFLRARPDVDPERFGIYGLSWGGYIAALGLARNSDIFKVGFDMAGVHEFFGAAFPYSPAADIDRWSSPVYLAQGDDDRNVDFSQGVTLSRLLQSRRPGVELVERVFPDETHDMYLTFEHLVDLYEDGSRFMLERLPSRE